VDYLTPKAKAALIRLANDEDTAEFAQEALKKHDLESVHPMPKTEPVIKAPVPEDLRAESQSLLTLLETWQESLPDLQQRFELEKLSDVDQALSTLIVYLREANNGSK
jgi:hypothetical protein